MVDTSRLERSRRTGPAKVAPFPTESRARMQGLGVVLLTVAMGCGGTPEPEQQPSGRGPDEAGDVSALTQLTAADAQAGWRLLSASLDGWRGYMSEDVPEGWAVEEGVLSFTPGGEGGDLITRDQFEDFELRLEWKVQSRGNSGIFYRVAEEGRYAYWTGPEMQVLDNEGHPDGQSPLTSAGANYGLHAPPEDVTRPVGDWNEVRIVVRGSDVEHWLNGQRVVQYTLGSPEWRALVADSKFNEWPGYGRAPRGHLGLQDHGDPVWFRNIRVRPLES